MEEVKALKYLGFVISDNASNVANILDKKNKSTTTIRNIMNIIQGLGIYTIQNGFIYLNSLLRASLLYAAETYFNLTEKNLRLIESIEEDCMRKILGTGKSCSMSLLYLETGHLPARFQIDIMMLNFLQYILHQGHDSLMFKFFKAQCESPTRGDWVLNVKKVIKNINLNITFEEITHMKKHKYQTLVNEKVRTSAFQYLLSKVKSKGKEINYRSLFQCQEYLLPNNFLTLNEQREIFSYRTRMNKLKYNFSGNNDKEFFEYGVEMTNLHLYECLKLNRNNKTVPYVKIFERRPCEMKSILNILQQNQAKHNEFTQAQDHLLRATS